MESIRRRGKRGENAPFCSKSSRPEEGGRFERDTPTGKRIRGRKRRVAEVIPIAESAAIEALGAAGEIRREAHVYLRIAAWERGDLLLSFRGGRLRSPEEEGGENAKSYPLPRGRARARERSRFLFLLLFASNSKEEVEGEGKSPTRIHPASHSHYCRILDSKRCSPTRIHPGSHSRYCRVWIGYWIVVNGPGVQARLYPT